MELSRQTWQKINVTISQHTPKHSTHICYACNLSKQPGGQVHSTLKHQFKVPIFKFFPLLTFIFIIAVYKFSASPINLNMVVSLHTQASPTAIKKSFQI